MDGFQWDIYDEEDKSVAEQIFEARAEEVWEVRKRLIKILTSFWDLQNEGDPGAHRFLEDAILKTVDELEDYEDEIDDLAKVAETARKVLEQASLN